MRWLALVGLLMALLAGCAELGVVSDGTSISVGRPSHGYLIEGARLPDHGEGFITREVWRARGNRFGTDELVDLVTAVARRMQTHVRDVKLVVADLSGQGGGERSQFHRSHQSGRDADLLYYMRDASGQPFEPDAMHVFDALGRATDGTGLTIDVPRTWALVRELITAPEAWVQWVFMYEPIAKRLIAHAELIGEPEALIARARKTLKQPGDSARHDDHLHVRVYCSPADKAYGCVDIGPMELFGERQAEPSPLSELVSALAAGPGAGASTSTPATAVASLPSSTSTPASLPSSTSTPASLADPEATSVAPSTASASAMNSAMSTATSAAATVITAPERLGHFLRMRIDRIYLRSWR
jgi:penicillin-insensitive murein DD-endopeptidase